MTRTGFIEAMTFMNTDGQFLKQELSSFADQFNSLRWI